MVIKLSFIVSVYKKLNKLIELNKLKVLFDRALVCIFHSSTLHIHAQISPTLAYNHISHDETSSLQLNNE